MISSLKFDHLHRVLALLSHKSSFWQYTCPHFVITYILQCNPWYQVWNLTVYIESSLCCHTSPHFDNTHVLTLLSHTFSNVIHDIKFWNLIVYIESSFCCHTSPLFVITHILTLTIHMSSLCYHIHSPISLKFGRLHRVPTLLSQKSSLWQYTCPHFVITYILQ